MSRRRRSWRRFLPWIAAALLVAVVGWTLLRTLGDRDYVAIATSLRIGDEAEGRPPDPVSSIEVLDKLLERKPHDYAALMEKSRAWAMLRSWDNAVESVRAAADSTSDVEDQIGALNQGMEWLMAADRYDDAVAMARQAVELQPDNPVRTMRLGSIYYKGSQSAQRSVVARFVDPLEKSMHDKDLEDRIEAFVTDVWARRDVDDFVADLLPNGDPVLVQKVSEDLVAARDRFKLANDLLQGYRNLGSFEPTIARAWVGVLFRTNRLYDAHIEAGLALRETRLNPNAARDFLDVQAQCSATLGDWAHAADTYSRLIENYLNAGYGKPGGPKMPLPYVYMLYEARVKAQHWDWILQHVEADEDAFGKDVLLRYASAAALEATGKLDAARDEILEPFASVSLGSKSFSSISLRAFPERRRAIAMLAYRLFSATGDSRAATALDSLLSQIPDDVEALRLRSALELSQGKNELAMKDAFALLSARRRDRADFDRWMAAADAFSIQRYGKPLAQRAVGKVGAADTWQRSHEDAAFVSFQTLGPRGRLKVPVVEADNLHIRADPAFSFAIVEELARKGNVERARNELRKLCDDNPQVQEFRYRLGRLLVRDGLFSSAIEEFLALLDRVPDDTETLDLATRTYDALGQHEEAANLINRMILQEPLSVGAVRYGQKLLDEGSHEATRKLIERLARWTDYATRLDVLVLAARTELAGGRVADAEIILTSLATQYPDSVDVAMLGLDVGLAKQQAGLVGTSVDALKPLAPELFPDQMQAVSGRMLAAGLHAELLEVFPPEVRALPAAQPALRSLAAAAKAVGQFEDADDILGRLQDDPDAVLDRFLLRALQGEADDAARRLRLQSVTPAFRNDADLCIIVSNALNERPALVDAEPLATLQKLGFDERLDPPQAQLVDALLRLLPAFGHLADALPHSVVDAPQSAWPLAARDITALVDLARKDPDAAREVGTDVLFLLLLGDRPFWRAESALLAEDAIDALPNLSQPARTLARRDMAAGNPREALRRLQALLVTSEPDPDDVQLFLEASRAFNHSEWGVALAFHFLDKPEIIRNLADTLFDWGLLLESQGLYELLMEQEPDDTLAIAGEVRALSAQRQYAATLDAVKAALDGHPDDEELAAVCGDALAAIPKPSPEVVERMQQLFDTHEELFQVGEALARAVSANPVQTETVLTTMVQRHLAHPPAWGSPEAQQRSSLLVRAARTARSNKLPAVARQLNELALRLSPGSISLYRELAFLDLDEGSFDTARRYLEVLSFVDLNDREAAISLARLDFQELGQPTRAADVVRRTFPTTMPPDAVEILAAENYLLGKPIEAINQFQVIANSPLLTSDTYLTVARIAYASGVADQTAKLLFEKVLTTAPPDDPQRPRVQYYADKLRDYVPPPAAAPAAQPAPAPAPPAEAPPPADAPAEPPSAEASTAGPGEPAPH